MRKTKRFKSELEILAAIHACHREAQAAIVQAESLETIAKQYFRMPEMVDDASLKMAEAQKLRRKADRLLDTKAVKLGSCLSEFQTTALPFLTDATVKAV